MLIATSQSCSMHPLVVVKGFGLPYQDPQPALWLYSLKITHPATKGLGRVKVFVNTTAHEEITLHLPLLAEHLCVTVRQQGRARVILELAAPQAAPGHRWESLRRKHGQLAPPRGVMQSFISKAHFSWE